MTGSGPGAIRGELASLLGDGAVVDDGDALRAYASASYPVAEHSPSYAVRPVDRGQVSSIVNLAAEAGVNLVPVSSGAPHVKGGSAPSQDGSVVVDLSEMREIIRFDRRNRVALVEPGVTFGTLRHRAGEEGLRPLMPLLPREGKSVVGSYLEREPTIIPKYQWDATDPLLCTEVVFGTGDVFRTGSAAGPGTLEEQWALGNAQKNPMGPAATDILKLVQGAQGTLGIATWASVKLELQPSVRRLWFVTGDSVEPLLSVAREMARKKLGDEMLLLDEVDLSLIASCAGGGAPGRAAGGGRFTLVYAVAGYPGYLPRERVAYQERDTEEILRRHGVRAAGDAAGVSGEAFAGLLDGPCPGRHWKTRLAGACQDVFFLTTMDRVPAFLEAMARIISERGIEPGTLGTYIQPVLQGRSCHLEFSIFYDPEDSPARARALEAASEAVGVMGAIGAFFSRPYEPWVAAAYERCGDTVDALRRVKGVFDPVGIMNRGKLCFQGGGAGVAR